MNLTKTLNQAWQTGKNLVVPVALATAVTLGSIGCETKTTADTIDPDSLYFNLGDYTARIDIVYTPYRRVIETDTGSVFVDDFTPSEKKIYEVNGVEFVKFGAIIYFLLNNDTIKPEPDTPEKPCGYHTIEGLEKGLFIGTSGAMKYLVDSRGNVLRASNDREKLLERTIKK